MGELFFLLILVFPALIALPLIAISHTAISLRKSHVPSQYWGVYDGQSPKSSQKGGIKLPKPSVDLTPPTVNQQHAVHFHP